MLKSLNALKISVKLPAVIALAAVLVGVGTGVSGYLIGAKAIADMSEDKLHTMAVSREHEIERLLKRIETDLRLYAEDPATIDALQAFSADFAALGSRAGVQLQQAYIADNPNQVGEKQLLDRADGSASYHVTHEEFHHFFRDVVDAKGYYDLFLFDVRGNLVYSMFKEADFARNFASGGGEFAESGLGTVFRDALAHESGHISFTDFAPYAPSAGAPAAFMATKVVDTNDQQLGVIALQMPAGQLNALFQDRTGLGETGETVLVGADGLLRTDSLFTDGEDILTTAFTADLVAHALEEKDYYGHSEDYRDMSLEAVALSYSFEGIEWIVAAVQGTDEVNQPLTVMRNLMLAIGAALTIAISAAGLWLSRTITRPIAGLTETMGRLADGDFEAEIDGADRTDELGAMASAVEVFKQNGLARVRLEGESEKEQAIRQERQKQIEQMIAEFRQAVGTALETVSANSTQMNNSADHLSGVADSTSTQADDAVIASRSAAENVQAVAAAAEELAASIEEISQQVSRTNSIVNDATNAANITNEKVAGLAAAARKIGDVISLIQDIAEQTNLLALNTSIEAARAGEAGKGFAVVASEVKSLANQTATATEEISAQIANIQNSTEDAVKAIEDIAKTMAEVNTYTASIASAVEEQGSATAEISQSVTHAAQGTEQVANSLSTVTSSVGDTRKSASEVQTASQDVARQTQMLKQTVDEFLQNVSAA